MSEPVLRLMEEADLPLLHEWLNRPHVAEWWGYDAWPSLEAGFRAVRTITTPDGPALYMVRERDGV